MITKDQKVGVRKVQQFPKEVFASVDTNGTEPFIEYHEQVEMAASGEVGKDTLVAVYKLSHFELVETLPVKFRRKRVELKK